MRSWASFPRQHALGLTLFGLLGASLGAASVRLVPTPRVAYCRVTLHPEPKTNPVDPDGRQQPESSQFLAGAERAFTSHESIRTTLTNLGYVNTDDGAVDAVASRLKFENVGGHDYVGTLREKWFSRSERGLVEFLAAHLKSYVDSEIQKNMQVFVAEVDFLRMQTAAAEEELRQVAAEMVRFRGAQAESPQESAWCELQLSRKMELLLRVLQMRDDLAAMRRQLARGIHLTREQEQVLQRHREELATLNAELRELRAQGLADGHPDVKRLMVNEQLHAAELARKSNDTGEVLHAQAGEIQGQLDTARAELRSVLNRLLRTPSKSIEWTSISARVDELARRRDGIKHAHSQLSERLRQAEVHLDLERVTAISRYEITVPPRLEPVNVKRTVLLRSAVGFALGAAFALLIAAAGFLQTALD